MRSKTTLKSRVKTGLALLSIPVLSFILIKNTTVEITKNRYNNELAKNGIHSLFAAFLNSELDYEVFYAVHDNLENFKQLHNLLKSENSKFVSSEPFDVTREITNLGEEKRYNVVFITVESLSAEFMGFKRNLKENPSDFSGKCNKLSRKCYAVSLMLLPIVLCYSLTYTLLELVPYMDWKQ